MADFLSTFSSGQMRTCTRPTYSVQNTTITHFQHQFYKPSSQQPPKHPSSAFHSNSVFPTRPLQHLSTSSKHHHFRPLPSYRPANPSQTSPARDQMHQIQHPSTAEVSQRARRYRARGLDGEGEVLRTRRRASCMSLGVWPWWL